MAFIISIASLAGVRVLGFVGASGVDLSINEPVSLLIIGPFALLLAFLLLSYYILLLYCILGLTHFVFNHTLGLTNWPYTRMSGPTNSLASLKEEEEEERRCTLITIIRSTSINSNINNDVIIQAGRHISELQELDSMRTSTELLKHIQEQEVLACERLRVTRRTLSTDNTVLYF